MPSHRPLLALALPVALITACTPSDDSGTDGDTGDAGARHDIARVQMRVETTSSPVEQFTIRVDPASSALVMEWGDFRWSVPIERAR